MIADKNIQESLVDSLADRVIAGVRAARENNESTADANWHLTRDEALAVASYSNLNELCEAADRITQACCEPGKVDTCSIVNARAGMCGEDCKWCAQATRYKTGCNTYNAINEEETLHIAQINEDAGVHRFSLVTSGRKVSEKDLPQFLKLFKKLRKETGLYLCASMGLLGPEQMKHLAEAGVKRYHCNMETSEKVFADLCTTHSPEDKKATIRAAREAGLEICSGGIIGMGENMDDRVDFALELRTLNPDSVPVNILNPMKGTPLESTPLIAEEEVIRTAAMFRFVLPTQTIRFAGGRARMSVESIKRMLRGGVNGVMMGDLLTSVGNKMEEDKRMLREIGLHY